MSLLFAAALAAVGVLIVLGTAGALSANNSFDGIFAGLINRLEDGDGVETTVNYIIGAGLIAAGVLILAIQTILVFSGDRLVVIDDSAIGTVRVSRRSINELAERAMKVDREVLASRCKFEEVDGQLELSCGADIRVGADINRITLEGQQRTKEAVEHLLGVRVREVDIDAKYVGSSKRLSTVE